MSAPTRPRATVYAAVEITMKDMKSMKIHDLHAPMERIIAHQMAE